MKKSLAIIILAMVAIVSQAQIEKNFIDQPYMEVTGKAELEVTPDEIYLTIRINEGDNKAKQSVEELEKAMIKTLILLDIDVEKDLTIVDFSSNFKNYLLKRTAILTAKQYQLKVTDGKTTAAVFTELEKIGISNISIDRVGHSKMDELRNEVKVMAIKAAKQKASLLAEAIGQKAGNALYIQELGNGYYPRVQRAGNMMMKAVAEASPEEPLPDIEFEKIKLEYSILVRFELLNHKTN